MIKIYQVDAFTDQPFHGNPAGVCILSEPKSDRWMQSIANEMNLSETAFLLSNEDGFTLRWFTPTTEVDLCGHATLASAHILWEQNLSDQDEIHFFTKSGMLIANRKEEFIKLDFPAEPAVSCDPPADLLESLGVEVNYIGKNRIDYLLEVESEEKLRNINPDWSLLQKVKTRGVIVTCQSSSDYDFVSRAFYPAVGINEDPVTGSAHCCLGPYWQKKLNKDSLIAYQASQRGGVIHVEVSGDRVILGGKAITMLIGSMRDE